MPVKKKAAKKRRKPRIGTHVETQPIEQFEYYYFDVQVGTFTKDQLMQQLTDLGLQGWLAYSAFESGGFYHFLFTRKVQ